MRYLLIVFLLGAFCEWDNGCGDYERCYKPNYNLKYGICVSDTAEDK